MAVRRCRGKNQTNYYTKKIINVSTISIQSAINKATEQFEQGHAKACVETLKGVLGELKVGEPEWYRLRNDTSFLLARLSGLERERGMISEQNYMMEWNKLSYSTNQLVLDFEAGVKEMAEREKEEEKGLYKADLVLGLNYEQTDLEEVKGRILRIESMLNMQLGLSERILGIRTGSVVVELNLYAEEIVKIRSLVKLELVDSAQDFKVLDVAWDWIEDGHFILQLAYCNLENVNLSGANLSGANLNGTILNKANLSGADLSGVSLSSSMIKEAIFVNSIVQSDQEEILTQNSIDTSTIHFISTHAQPNLSARIGGNNRILKLISFSLAAGLTLVVGFISWNWIKTSEFKKEQEAYKQEQREKARQREEEEKLKYLEDHFPEAKMQPYVFFADGKLTLERGNEVILQLTLTGSSFLTNKGRLITARHVIQRFDYPENCIEAIATKLFYDKNIAGYSLSTSTSFASPILQIIVHKTKFMLAADKPQYRSLGCDTAKTCSVTQDWAVARPENLIRIRSEIELDRDYSKNILVGTKLVILSYRDSKSFEPQIKEVNLSLKEPMPNSNNNIEIYKINNPSFGPGDSGAPVFAFNKAKKKWVVVGIVKGGEGSIETTRWGIILPIVAIEQNLLE